MTKSRLLFVVTFLAALVASCRAQSIPMESAHAMIADMVYNDLQDRERDSYWQYRIQEATDKQTLVEEQVETPQGPIFRILKRNGAVLAGQPLKEENARLDHLMHSPDALEKNKEEHEQDEQRLRRLMRLMPEAFLFSYEGAPTGDLVKIKFWPNPSFTPPTYEARVYHGLGGICLVNTRYKRLVDIKGKLIARIDFGYGILGHVEKGGTFEIQREQVSPSHWKTDLVDIHVQGRVILFKTITKNEHEVRSQFKPVPRDITLDQARQILDKAATSVDAAATVGHK